jgi:hypothetical protein
MAKVIACSACGGLFTPKRSTRRFCTSRCRVLAHRGPRVEGPARGIRRVEDAFLSVSCDHTLAPVPKPAPVTLKPLIPCGLKQSFRNSQNENLPDGIVPDENWPGMYRIRLSNKPAGDRHRGTGQRSRGSRGQSRDRDHSVRSSFALAFFDLDLLLLLRDFRWLW